MSTGALHGADGASDWQVLAGTASAWFAAPTHNAGAALTRRLTELDLPVDLSVRSTGVRVDTAAPDGDRGITEGNEVNLRTSALE